jgi:hypothetical protein
MAGLNQPVLCRVLADLPQGWALMIKVLYKPLSLAVSVAAGILARAVFKKVWQLSGGEVEASKATDADRGWPEILLAAALHGAAFAVVKAAVDRGAVKGARKLRGTWPGDDGK